MADQPANLTPPPPPPPPQPPPARTADRDDDIDLRAFRRRPNRVVAWVRGWSAEHLSRENVAGAAWTMLWVIPLTVLIWIYAERQQLVPLTGTLPIQVTSDDPTKVVRLLGDETVIANLIGPPAAIDGVLAKFNPRNGNRPVEIRLDRALGVGEQRIPSRRIQDDKRLTEDGIEVKEVSPPEIRVFVDQIVTRPFRVRAYKPEQFPLPPVFDPPEITVTGPARLLTGDPPAFEIVADVAVRLQGLPPADGERKLDGVKVAAVGALDDRDAPNVKLSQTVVSVRVAPIATKEGELQVVRLFPSASPAILNANTFEFPDNPSGTLANLKVFGPKEAVDKLMASPEAPVAEVRIPESVIQAGEGPVPFRPDLPPGVVPKDDRKTVRIIIRPNK